MSFVINPYRFGGGGGGPPAPTFGNNSRLFLSASSQDIEVADDAAFPTGAQTWCCWMKLAGAVFIDAYNMMGKNIDAGNNRSARLRVLGTNDNLQAFISPNGQTPFTSVSSSTNSITLDTWHHVAFTFEPSTHLKLYIDGIEDGSNTTSIPATIYDGTAPFYIGSLDGALQFFDGRIADVRIYDADIGATEIANLAAGTDYQTNLVGWWLTDTDDAVTDFAGTFADATNNGTTYSTDGPLDP